jgi:hypothetical protein
VKRIVAGVWQHDVAGRIVEGALKDTIDGRIAARHIFVRLSVGHAVQTAL